MKQPERYVEPRLTQYLFDRASRTLTPLSGTFELSPVCNLACKMCYVRKTPAEVAASPRPPVGLIQWLSIAEQARDAGMLYLLLTGGEPFLWQDFWPLYERLSTMGFLISINSNGTLLDEARVARLAEHPPTRINITLYGAGNETYEALCGRSGMFDRVDRAVRRKNDDRSRGGPHLGGRTVFDLPATGPQGPGPAVGVCGRQGGAQ